MSLALRRTVGFVAVGLLGTFAACGNPEVVLDDGFGSTSGGSSNAGAGFGASAADTGGGRSGIGLGGESSGCDPKSCEELGAKCGAVADGCGNIVQCGDCADGETCGVEEPNICSDSKNLCVPTSKSKACEDKECGFEGDGCGSVYNCGTCDDGLACGVEEAFRCGDESTGGGDCKDPIESCAAAGARCGVIGDGCGGTLDCTAELGACPRGTFCGVREAYQCDEPATPPCTPAKSCAELGWACGAAVDDCGNTFDCAAEGRKCKALELCVGAPTKCVAQGACALCPDVPTCTGAQSTRLTGRVITPGRNNADTADQVGVPNAFVYILRSDNLADLPAIPSGIPTGGTRCDRCTEQDLGPILAGTMTDATGRYTLQGNIPVGKEFLLVTKVGKFRRATRLTLPSDAACKTTNLPLVAANNPTRLPRDMADGLAVNLPRIAVTTGQIDAMECVFEKMGIAHGEFSNPGANGAAAPRVHLYRGGASSTPSGARIDGNTPHDAALYANLARLELYDMVVADCEGMTWDSTFSQGNRNYIREYVNRGGRMFASHLSFSWLRGNGGTTAYSAANPNATSLGLAAAWQDGANTGPDSGTGIISLGRPHASPRIESFRDWMVSEGVTTAPDYHFTIIEPRSQVSGSSLESASEEFVHCDGGDCTGSNRRTQQFSFNTPYAAPAAAACGRVAYSGFHVSVGGGTNPFGSATFPAHCAGTLTAQEKVLLYMLFDLGACVGDEPGVPKCTPVECGAGRCGVIPDGCGGTINCGSCTPPCTPTTCKAQGAECGAIGDGCSATLDCGPCPPGQTCGAAGPNQCGGGSSCTPGTCEAAAAECGKIGDGCGNVLDCGECPKGLVCGLEEPYKCAKPPACEPLTCESVGAQCGVIADGCAGTADCGDCPPGEVCGAQWANICTPIR